MEELYINCENGCRLAIYDIVMEDLGFSAKVFLKSDWYEATVPFKSSQDRLVDFLEGLKKILLENHGKANFINDEGNFDLDISLNEFTGKVQINGILIKSMMDDSRIEYFMESDYLGVEKLKDNLISLIGGSL